MVALIAGEPEQPLLEDRVLPVPQRDREAETLVVVADAEDAVLASAVGPGSRVVVGHGLPGGAVVAVVLPAVPHWRSDRYGPLRFQ
jgi:hypothetical protein